MRKTVLIMSVFAILAWPAAADEALLRKAWTIRDQDKAALLAEASTRLAELVTRWPSEPKLRNAPLRDDNVRWLLRNRMATYLVLDAELAKKPQGPARTVQLYLASRLRWRSLGQYLPPLLDECKTDAERLEVVQCMAAVRDAKSLQAMGKLLEAHKPDGNEGLLIAAVRGLGLSRQPVYLPVVQSARRKAKGPAARLAVAQAAVRCGDPAAMAQVAECLGRGAPASVGAPAVEVADGAAGPELEEGGEAADRLLPLAALAVGDALEQAFLPRPLRRRQRAKRRANCLRRRATLR